MEQAHDIEYVRTHEQHCHTRLGDRLRELRREEAGCLARVTSIQRKLAVGSTAVNLDDLRVWRSKLGFVQEQLITLGFVPLHSA